MLLVVPILQYMPYSIYSFIIPIPSILYLYKPGNLKSFVKEYILALIVAAIFGGLVFNIWFQLGGELKISLLIIVGTLTTFIFISSFYAIRRRFIFPAFEYDLQINTNSETTIVNALLDTGNCLYTPITHEPVIVMQYDAIKNLLTEEQQAGYEEFISDKLTFEEKLMTGNCIADALIPFNSVGCKDGFLWGVRVKEIFISKGMGSKKIENAIIGVSREGLFSDRQYKALLHPEFLIEEVVYNGNTTNIKKIDS